MIDETTGGLVYELKKAGELGEGSAFTARLEVGRGDRGILQAACLSVPALGRPYCHLLVRCLHSWVVCGMGRLQAPAPRRLPHTGTPRACMPTGASVVDLLCSVCAILPALAPDRPAGGLQAADALQHGCRLHRSGGEGGGAQGALAAGAGGLQTCSPGRWREVSWLWLVVP